MHPGSPISHLRGPRTNRRAENSKSRCIYCGQSGKMTDEHPWGKWTRPYVPRDANKHTSGRVSVPIPGKPLPLETRIRAGDALDFSARVVCSDCNSRWMSQLQERAKPHLIPLFDARAIALTEEAQAAVSTWIAMGVMTAEYSDNERSLVGVSPGEREMLMNRHLPPHGWRIWIGRVESAPTRMRWIHSAFPILDADELPATVSEDDRRPNGQTTSFVVGKLFFFTVSTPFPGLMDGWDWRTARRARSRLEPIWPIKYPVIYWPPPSLSSDDVASVGTSLTRYFEDLALRKGYR